MNSFLRSRLCRCCVCLILVLVLLISWSPIRVQASALPEVAGVATKVIPFAKVVEPAALGIGGSLFCWVAAALGVGFTVYAAVDAYNNFQDYSGMLETSIYYYPDGTWSYGVDLSFVERVRNFLFSDGYLIASDHHFDFAVERQFRVHDQFFTLRADEPFSVVGFRQIIKDGTRFNAAYYAFGPDLTILRWSSTSKTAVDYGAYSAAHFGGYSNGSIANNSDSDIPIIDVESLDNVTSFFGTELPPDITTDMPDVELGQVAPLEVPMPEAYPDWHTNARPATNPDTQEEITVLPIPLNPSADPETQIGTLTQPDIWQGTIADPMPDMDTNPDTGTNPDPGTGVPSDIGKYQIDLKDFFPFCIPFDLYDFFSCLAADPVAPVIEWVIPLPGGDTYPLEIDLSAFDGVAQLLRRLQLLLFCVGLAFKTRDLIKG